MEKRLRQRMEYKWLDKSGYSKEKIESLVAKGVVDPRVASLVVADHTVIKTKPPVKRKVKSITFKEKIYNYLDEHPESTTSETRKAAGCKLSTAKKYRGQWLSRKRKNCGRCYE